MACACGMYVWSVCVSICVCVSYLSYLSAAPGRAPTLHSATVTDVMREWIPTSKCHRQSGLSQERHSLPFYSPTVTSIGLLLCYQKDRRDSFSHTMIISVAALLSSIRSGVSNVPWVDWGPSSTHLTQGRRPISAGPFWITCRDPLVVCDYDLLRVRYTQSKMGRHHDRSHHVTELNGVYWEAYTIETYLPSGNVVEDDRILDKFPWLIANREWIVGLTYSVCDFWTHTSTILVGI
jgi:hypothetical protein